MAGLVRLVPAIHVFEHGKDVDARAKAGMTGLTASQPNRKMLQISLFSCLRFSNSLTALSINFGLGRPEVLSQRPWPRVGFTHAAGVAIQGMAMPRAPRAEKRLADVIGRTSMAVPTIAFVGGRNGRPTENTLKRLLSCWKAANCAADSTTPDGPRLSSPRRPLITMRELFVLAAYALWSLLLYSFAILILQHASGLALPNPFTLLPSEYRHHIPFSN
jgi:hypothetical protein